MGIKTCFTTLISINKFNALNIIINSLLLLGFNFSVINFIALNSGITFLDFLLYSTLISVVISGIYFLMNIKFSKKTHEEVKTHNDYIGQVGYISYVKTENNSPINEYIGILKNNSNIYLYSIDILKENDIFVITEFSDGKFYCVKQQEE